MKKISNIPWARSLPIRSLARIGLWVYFIGSSGRAMLLRFVDNVLAVAKESVKTFTYESLNNIARLINGFSALLLAILPGKIYILEGMHGWELRPSFRGPRLPRWMDDGVSSFNQFLHNLSDEFDSSLIPDCMSEEEDNDQSMLPGSPTSQASHLSRASSFYRYDRRFTRILKYSFSWIVWPVTLLMSIPWLIYHHTLGFRTSGISHSSHLTGHQYADLHMKRANCIKHNVVHRTTDRRRGVIEDLQLAIEIFIESVFDIFHKAAHLVLSPCKTLKMMSRWFSPRWNRNESTPIPTATLGEDEPTPTERRATFHQSLNTDARTCEDVIREHGYPYEAIRVVTYDGYVLLLERIPRPDSRKVVYLQHGIMDSSLGWVSNGVVGSPAFAAFDQGYDVYLGNLRGLVSREHIDKNISSRRYWKYSINEHGTQDVTAIIEKIHTAKTSELHQSNHEDGTTTDEQQPYTICAVSHSLGGAAVLMYVVTCGIARKPHRLSRLILLSPAGFHEDSNIAFTVAEHVMLLFGPMFAPFIPGLYIPSKFFRMLLNKLARDFHNYPALGGLVQTIMSYVVGGDTSNWVGVLGLTHYNMHDMPGISLHVAIHLAQMKREKRFLMYNFGSEASNMEAYGTPKPLDIGDNYNLIDIPVDLVGGRGDQVICPSMVKKHYKLMRKAKVEVSYNEFEYGHLDFTFSHREELLAYVMSRVLMVAPAQEKQTDRPHPTTREKRMIVMRINHSRKNGVNGKHSGIHKEKHSDIQ